LAPSSSKLPTFIADDVSDEKNKKFPFDDDDDEEDDQGFGFDFESVAPESNLSKRSLLKSYEKNREELARESDDDTISLEPLPERYLLVAANLQGRDVGLKSSPPLSESGEEEEEDTIEKSSSSTDEEGSSGKSSQFSSQTLPENYEQSEEAEKDPKKRRLLEIQLNDDTSSSLSGNDSDCQSLTENIDTKLAFDSLEKSDENEGELFQNDPILSSKMDIEEEEKDHYHHHHHQNDDQPPSPDSDGEDENDNADEKEEDDSKNISLLPMDQRRALLLPQGSSYIDDIEVEGEDELEGEDLEDDDDDFEMY